MLNMNNNIKQLEMLVGYKSIKIVVNKDSLYDKFDRTYCPSKFIKILTDCCAYSNNVEFFYFPYINPDSFKLFLNLISTPRPVPVTNPKNLSLEDLEPVFMTFAYYSGANGTGNDDDIVENIKQRYREEFL